jgi:hypothetical protein
MGNDGVCDASALATSTRERQRMLAQVDAVVSC